MLDLYCIIKLVITWSVFYTHMALVWLAHYDDLIDYQILTVVFGELSQNWYFETYVPKLLDFFSKLAVLWTMNLSFQYSVIMIAASTPSGDVLETIPEFSPRNVAENVLEHLHINNPVNFCHHELKRLWLYIRFLWHCRSVSYTSKCIDEVMTQFEDTRTILLPYGGKIPFHGNAPGHTHPNSASFRTAVNEYLKETARDLGYNPYNVSYSAHDDVGSRYFYFLKDLSLKYKDDPIPDNALLIFTDVDYYANMNAWLLLRRPIMMYTFAPTRLAGRTDEYSYRIVNNMVEYQTRGGGSYKHPLWDYKGDCISVQDPRTGSLVSYSVEQRTIEGDPDHRLVMLIPTALVPYPECLYVNGHNPLRRKNMSSGSLNYLFNPITGIISTARNKSWSSVEINVDLLTSIRRRLENKTAAPLVSDIEKYLTYAKESDAVIKAPILLELINVDFCQNVISTSQMSVAYQPFNTKLPGEIISEDGKPKGAIVSKSIYSQPGLFPTKSVATDLSSVKGRFLEPRNNKDPPRDLKSYKGEFINQLVPTDYVGTGTPISSEEVRERQSKPAQRARFDRFCHYFSTECVGVLSCFIKPEVYDAPKYPRNITQVNQSTTVLLSEYTYAFKETIMKKQQWYGPGKTPAETIIRLSELTTPDGVLTTDFSNFDGSISPFLTGVANSTYMRYFDMGFKTGLDKLIKSVYNKTAYTENGIKYDAGSGTRSGSPFTTDSNTIINAYVMYCALRRCGMKPVAAYQNIGIACGDDGYMRSYPGLPGHMEQVCHDLGLVLKAEVRYKGPYPYLGRYFVDPSWSISSFQDPPRTLKKAHSSGNTAVSASQARVNKAKGYLITDARTPLVGDIFRVHLKPAVGDDESTDYGGANFTSEENYKAGLAWPQDPSDIDDITAGVAETLGITSSELLAMATKVKDCSSYLDIPVFFDNDRENKITAAVGGDINYAPGDESGNAPQEGDFPGPLNPGETITDKPSLSAHVTTVDKHEPKQDRPDKRNPEAQKQSKGKRNDAGNRPPEERGKIERIPEKHRNDADLPGPRAGEHRRRSPRRSSPRKNNSGEAVDTADRGPGRKPGPHRGLQKPDLEVGQHLRPDKSRRVQTRSITFYGLGHGRTD